VFFSEVIQKLSESVDSFIRNGVEERRSEASDSAMSFELVESLFDSLVYALL
jgi:hypothetical protein